MQFNLTSLALPLSGSVFQQQVKMASDLCTLLAGDTCRYYASALQQSSSSHLMYWAILD